MGVSTNFYTIYGIKIDEYPNDFSEAYDDVYDDDDTPFVLMDGMCGEYMIFGEILFDSGDLRWGFENGDAFKSINLEDLADTEKDYKEQFIKKFPQFSHYMDGKFQLMTLAHFS
jgi:hypothetical protein